MNVSKGPNNLGTFYTNLGKTANQHLNSIAKSTNDTVNSLSSSLSNIAKNTPRAINSLLPPNSSKNNNLSFLSALSPASASNSSNSLKSSAPASGGNVIWPILLFIIITVLFISIYMKNKETINNSVSNIIQKIRSMFNEQTAPLAPTNTVTTNITAAGVSPQEEKLESVTKKHKSLVDKLLPIGNPEVFNVSKNDFPYYDAEPLCRALGAELATYDQVKEAWSKGADWCNYGWVKGQSAVYPIQEETYSKIQAGPEENRNSCGTVGLNGGYFENPEMKFGVNCYGIKPVQSEHDEEILMKNGSIPQTVPALAIDKKTQEFKKESDNLGLLPFNNHKWHD